LRGGAIGLANAYKVAMPVVKTQIAVVSDAFKDIEVILGGVEEQVENTSRNIGWEFARILELQRDVAYGFSSLLVDAVLEADKNISEVIGRWILQLAELILKETIAAAILKSIGLGAYTEGTLGGAILGFIGFRSGGIVQGFRPLVGSFQEGGVVTRPTLALVGEGGEREFIIPESKFPKPQVFVSIYNATPDTYVEIFTKWSTTGRQKFYREVIKRAQAEAEI